MYTLPMKRWFYGDTSRMHNFALRIEHIAHDERFWPAVVAIGLMAAFIALVIWAGLYGGGTVPEKMSTYPVYPFLP